MIFGKALEARKSLLSKIPPFTPPPGGYTLLYPDPPWQYRDKGHARARGAGHKYATLSLAELKAMRPEIDRISAPDSALALWATAPMMGEARDLMAAWGFRYSTIAMTWIKTVQIDDSLKRIAKRLQVHIVDLVEAIDAERLDLVRPRMGMGNWTRGNAEFLLLGTRGKVERASKGVGSVIITEPREHSRKPDEARDALVELFGDVPRLEMFGRSSAPGWACWGLEAGKFDPEAAAA